MIWLSWLISGFVAATVAGWALYLFGLHELPAAERPEVATFDRWGRPKAKDEAPDYRIMPGHSTGEDSG